MSYHDIISIVYFFFFVSLTLSVLFSHLKSFPERHSFDLLSDVVFQTYFGWRHSSIKSLILVGHYKMYLLDLCKFKIIEVMKPYCPILI